MDNVCNAAQRRAAGFTLVELLVAIAVLALSIYSIQSFAELMAAASQRAARQELKALLASARQEAVMRNQRLTLCRAQGADQCAGDALAGSYEWSSVLLFVDQDQDRLYSASSDQLLRHVQMPENMTIYWNRGEAISYEPDGTVTGYSNGTFTLSFDEGPDCLVVLALSGRIRESCS
jgi:prepilin-type N-terminal cleavage/methylation domain-containing protein